MVQIENRQFPMYDIPTMLRLKLKSFHHRETDEDLEDIEWLAENHETIVKAIRNNLNYEHIEFFFRAYIERRGQNQNAEKIKEVFEVTWPPEE